MKEPNEPKEKVDLLADIRGQLTKIAEAATVDDKALVREIGEKAKAGERVVRLSTLSPAVCAILFLNDNTHNRDFIPQHALELSRRMGAGLWKPNNATIGFYVDGSISDGQHRLSAAALGGYSLKDYPIVFGMARDAIDTVDSPKVRDGASHAKLDGIQDANTKQAVVKAFSAYMVRCGEKSYALNSASEVKASIEANDQLLDACIRIGEESCKNRLNPVLKPRQAAATAYLMLKNDWPEQRVREKLALFQTGESQDGENAPYFIAGKILTDSRRAREARDRLTGVKEQGVVIYAMVQTEKGIKATKPTTIKSEVKGKTLPNPRYPIREDQPVAA